MTAPSYDEAAVIAADAAIAAPAAGNGLAFGDRRHAWFAVGALCATSVVSMLERNMITLMYEPIKHDLHISDTQVSLLSGFAMVVFSAIFGIYFGRLADRRNRKWLISIGVVAWSFAAMSCGLARSFMQLFASRVCVGVGEATLAPSAMSIIADYFPRERLPRALSFYSASVLSGAGLALVFGGAIIHFIGRLPLLTLPYIGALHSWQETFFVVGLAGNLVLIPLAFVKEPRRKGLISSAAETRKNGLPVRDVLAYMARHWRFYVAFIVGFSLENTSAAGALAWTPSYFIRVHGWTPLEVGAFYGIALTVVGTTGVLLGGWIVEWMDARGFSDTNMRVPAYALLLAFVPSIFAYMMPFAAWSAALIVVVQLIGGVSTAPFTAALQLVTPNEMRGQVVAMFALAASFAGSGLGPTLVALFTDYVFRNDHAVGWSIIAVMLLLKPVVLVLLFWSLKPYREGLTEANARATAGLSAS